MTPADARLEVVVGDLLTALRASRVTVRSDTAGPYFPIVAEALAPGVATLRNETLSEVRQSPPFRFLEEHRRPLVQDDVLDHEVDASGVLRLFGFRSQVLVPIVHRDVLTGFLSVHLESGPHAWTRDEVDAAVEAAARATALLADPPDHRPKGTPTMMDNSTLLHLDQVEWTPIEQMWGDKGVSIPKSGCYVAVIREDEETGSITTMVKLPPGWNDNTWHYHQKLEESIVISGDISWSGQRFDAPAYYAIPALEVHGHVTSENGAVIVMRHDGGIEQTMVDAP